MTFLHDAQFITESWKRRHSPEAIKQMGAWRWKGIQNHASMIINEILGKNVIDFGGRDAPLGFGSTIIDQGDSIDLCWSDVVFTSHTMEHIEDISGVLKKFYTVLERDGGVLIAHVPAFTCERWRSGIYRNEKQTDHVHTFCLTEHSASGYTCIDKLITDAGFNIEFAEYVGDDSILVTARRPI